MRFPLKKKENISSDFGNKKGMLDIFSDAYSVGCINENFTMYAKAHPKLIKNFQFKFLEKLVLPVLI